MAEVPTLSLAVHIVNAYELKRDGIYLLRIPGIGGPSATKLMSEIGKQVAAIGEKAGCTFILMGDDFEIVNPEVLTESPQFRAAMRRILKGPF